MTAMLLLGFMALQVKVQPSEGWHYSKVDPATHRHIVEIDAASFMVTKEPHTFRLQDMTLRLYNPTGVASKTIIGKEALIDEETGTVTYGAHLKKVLKLSQ